MTLRVVGHRVDALTLAYRVDLHAGAVERLRERAQVAKEHGRAAFRWRKHVFGELRYSRADRVWNIRNASWMMRIDLCAAGKVESLSPTGEKKTEPGWTVEIVWDAQALAALDVADVLKASRRLASLLAGGDGTDGTGIWETRLRRIDLAADVAGWEIRADDVRRLVRRSRCGVREDPPRPCESASKGKPWGFGCGKSDCKTCGAVPAQPTLFQKQKVTGISVGKDSMMMRIYDKPEQLASKPRDTREAEEARWRAGGWDGEAPVTRVEFQLRGHVLKEFGVRNPDLPIDPATHAPYRGGLPEVVSRLWRACVGWARLVEPRYTKRGKPIAAGRCPDDPRWAVVSALDFRPGGAPGVAVRRTQRGSCSTAQISGAMLSVLAARGRLPRFSEADESPDAWGADAGARLWDLVAGLGLHASDAIVADLVERWGTPETAMAHVVVSVRAASERARAAALLADRLAAEPKAEAWHKDDGAAQEWRGKVLAFRRRVPWGAGGRMGLEDFVRDGRAHLARCGAPGVYTCAPAVAAAE